MVYSVSQWTGAVVLGVLVGAIGQLVRSISGMARRNRERAIGEVEAFKVSTMVVSLVIGGVAGAVSAMALMSSLYPEPPKGVEFSTILGIAAAGYTGADFIEGVAGKFLPGATGATDAPLLASSMAAERLTSAASTVATAGVALSAAATGLAAGVATGSAPRDGARGNLSGDEPAVG